MRRLDVTLDDKFLLPEGRVFITGVQALLRVLLDQHRLDKAAGLNTASDYEAGVDRVMGLTPERLPLAAKIAEVP